jgi:hypothetical protein
MDRAQIIRNNILHQLEAAEGNPVPVGALTVLVRADVRPQPSDEELGSNLDWLKDRGLIAPIDAPLGGVEWTLTAKGEAALRR